MISKTTIKSSIKDLLQQMASVEDKEESYETFAESLANIIVDAIKSADVKVNQGIPVSVTTSQGPAVGATTSVGSGSLS